LAIDRHQQRRSVDLLDAALHELELQLHPGCSAA